MRHGEAAHDLGLQPVRVLVLVDHDVAVRPRELRGDVGVVADEIAEEHEEVVVVDEVAITLVTPVPLLEAYEVLQVLVEVRVAILEQCGHRGAPVHRHAEDLDDRVLAREAAFFAVESRPAAQQVHHVLGVAAVEDGEARLHAEPPRGAAEDDVGEGVERAARHLLATRADQRRSPPQHLFRRLAGEREEQDLPRLDEEEHVAQVVHRLDDITLLILFERAL